MADDVDIIREDKRTRTVARADGNAYERAEQRALTQNRPLAIGEVVGAAIEQTFQNISDAVQEYERVKEENGRLRGICEALTRENERLQAIVDRVVAKALG